MYPVYPELSALIDAKIDQMLEESRKMNQGERSYAFVVGQLQSEIKWAIAENNLNALKEMFNVPDRGIDENTIDRTTKAAGAVLPKSAED
ncbi:MAG: hypothetical protein IBX56_03425 [Methylomicrobium sp.]|nr:hypothetical protein [Methylomicrobium sp.]